MFVLQSQSGCLLLFVTQELHCDFVTRTFLGDDGLKIAKLLHFLSVNMGQHVTLLKSSISGSTIFDHLINIYALHGAEVFNLFILIFHAVNIVLDIHALDSNHSTLVGTVLLEVVNSLVDNSGRNGKSVANVRACLRVNHGVDANEFATCVDQCTTRVTLIDCSIGLNH